MVYDMWEIIFITFYVVETVFQHSINVHYLLGNCLRPSFDDSDSDSDSDE